MRDPNLSQLMTAADALRPLLGELVFVGGCVTGLLITDEGAPDPRATLDVDVIAEITSYIQYAEFGERLRALGFREDSSEGAPLCRWIRDRTILDLMPLNENILGFSNRWYKDAFSSSTMTRLSGDLEIRIISAPYFLVTKLAAFQNRGKGDFLGSHDLEDLATVIDGRETLSSEVRREQPALRTYIQDSIGRLLSDNAFIDALSGYLLPDPVSQSRIGIVLSRLEDLARASRPIRS
jgi:predicted nucleotidyltransferase